MSDPSVEVVQATNIVDAAAESKVQVLVFSTLEDMKTASVRLLRV